jgi:hypothetical protein
MVKQQWRKHSFMNGINVFVSSVNEEDLRYGRPSTSTNDKTIESDNIVQNDWWKSILEISAEVQYPLEAFT